MMHISSSLIRLKPLSLPTLPFLHSSSVSTSLCYSKASLPNKFPPVSPGLPVCSVVPGDVTVSDLVEKDWSFLDFEVLSGDGELKHKIDQIISAGNLKETSKVLVNYGSEAFIDELVSSSPFEFLLHVHDSLMILASIKEKYDEIKCWQGEVVNIPEKWSNFDVIYLYFLPCLPLELDQVLAAIARRCSPGARVVISHPEGRQSVEDLKQQFPEVVVSSLPEKSRVLQAAAENSYEVVEFIDEPGFYLSVLTLNRNA